MPETAIIKKLKDGSENVVLPVTHERAVRDDSGTTLETKLQDITSTATSNLAESKSYTDTLNSAMNTRVSTNSQDIETLKSDVLELQTGLGTQETKESALEDTVDILEAKLEALAAGMKVSGSSSPAVIYKGTATTVTLSGSCSGITPDSMTLKDGSTVLETSTSARSITKALTSLTLTADSKSYTVEATYKGMTMSSSITLQARYPIYYGFSDTPENLYAGTKGTLSARTSAATTYPELTVASGLEGQHFIILVPSDISALSSFSMGGAPYVMTSGTATLGGITYKTYTSGATYSGGSKVKVTAQ